MTRLPLCGFLSLLLDYRFGLLCGLKSSRSDLCVYFCVGNILVIVIVAANKTFHSVTSVLIMNLAISDLLVGVGVMPFVALSILNRGWVDCTVRHLCPVL